MSWSAEKEIEVTIPRTSIATTVARLCFARTATEAGVPPLSDFNAVLDRFMPTSDNNKNGDVTVGLEAKTKGGAAGNLISPASPDGS